MKKVLILSTSLFCMALGLNAQQQKSTNAPKVAKATKAEAPSEIRVIESKPESTNKLHTPTKVEKRNNPAATRSVKSTPDPRLRVKKAKPESAKPAGKTPDSK
jgi:maltose-binding protein MalE